MGAPEGNAQAGRDFRRWHADISRGVISSWLILSPREGVNQLSREQEGIPNGSKEQNSKVKLEAQILRGAWGQVSREEKGEVTGAWGPEVLREDHHYKDFRQPCQEATGPP